MLPRGAVIKRQHQGTLSFPGRLAALAADNRVGTQAPKNATVQTSHHRTLFHSASNAVPSPRPHARCAHAAAVTASSSSARSELARAGGALPRKRAPQWALAAAPATRCRLIAHADQGTAAGARLGVAAVASIGWCCTILAVGFPYSCSTPACSLPSPAWLPRCL